MNSTDISGGKASALEVHELAPGSHVLSQGADLTMLATVGSDVVVPLHLHDRHDEYGVLVAGLGTLTIGDQNVDVGPGSTWAIPRGVPHGGRYTGEFRVVVWFAPGDDLDQPDRVNLE